MTTKPNNAEDRQLPGAPSTSLLPFEPEDLAQGLRVSQADFARMCKVSRQTVSTWVKKGKIRSVFPDGTMDPRQAAREVIRNTDPARLRAKVFKVATEDSVQLRRRVADLERQLRASQEQAAYHAERLLRFVEVLTQDRAKFIVNAGLERFAAEISLSLEIATWYLSRSDVESPGMTEVESADSSAGPGPLFDHNQQAEA